MNIAVLGAWHVHTMEYSTALQKNPDSTLCCLWDSDPERGAQMAEKLGVPFQPDLDAVLSDPSIEGVSVTTATSEHPQVLMAAAKAGKHIFTEKVLAFTNEEAEEIAKTVKQSGIIFSISYPNKPRPTLKAAKEILESGKLGQVTYARVRNVHNGSTAGWLPPHFYNAAETGGGAMMDLGAHPMYTLHWLMGEPKSVVSMFTTVTGKPVEDNAVSVLEFENGALGVSETGFVSTGLPYVLELSGTKGSLMVHNDLLEYSSEETEGKLVKLETLPEPDPMPIDAWIAALGGKGTAPNGIDEAVALTRLMVGAYESYRTRAKNVF